MRKGAERGVRMLPLKDSRACWLDVRVAPQGRAGVHPSWRCHRALAVSALPACCPGLALACPGAQRSAARLTTHQ